MAKNIIYYGPPGTGKTYYMQKLISDYTDYKITDDEIVKAYTNYSQDWLLFALIILQSNTTMTTEEIIKKVNFLNLGYKGHPSEKLTEHSLNEDELITKSQPRIFFENDGRWYVDRLRLFEYEPDFGNKYIKSEAIDRRYDFVTFHQSFVYEDFIEGIRPVCNTKDNIEVDDQNTNSTIKYSIQDGIFKQLCQKAIDNPHKQYALFIDEINRGNIAEIFGELISLIETDKRKGQYCELETILPYSKKPFSVPSNLDIIGTMNSADKSIAGIDIALRRRFEFINRPCDYNSLKNTISANSINPNDIEGIDIINLLKTLNQRLELLLDENHIIGHAYFIKVKSASDIIDIIRKKIIPLLEEFFFDDLQKIQLVLNDLDENGELLANAIYRHKELDVEKILPFVGDYDIENKKTYKLNEKISVESIIKIYQT